MTAPLTSFPHRRATIARSSHMPFRDIIGHRRSLRLLSRAVSSGTLPPSLLFAGPEGVGKRQTAVALAQALNCVSPLRDVVVGSASASTTLPIDACGECAACRRIARGVHPDVVLLAPEGDRVTVAIDQIRALNEQIAYRPFEGRRPQTRRPTARAQFGSLTKMKGINCRSSLHLNGSQPLHFTWQP